MNTCHKEWSKLPGNSAIIKATRGDGSGKLESKSNVRKVTTGKIHTSTGKQLSQLRDWEISKVQWEIPVAKNASSDDFFE